MHINFDPVISGDEKKINYLWFSSLISIQMQLHVILYIFFEKFVNLKIFE